MNREMKKAGRVSLFDVCEGCVADSVLGLCFSLGVGVVGVGVCLDGRASFVGFFDFLVVGFFDFLVVGFFITDRVDFIGSWPRRLVNVIVSDFGLGRTGAQRQALVVVVVTWEGPGRQHQYQHADGGGRGAAQRRCCGCILEDKPE
ncbi:hypothetical protein CVT25_000699 [Psilocybe cyanescens]|uniref:Uncharacterized protein n=1 Tax=Psilocybe cyanescens TaxID=93625 RepID=A0A409WZE9_PSICY|nr:hypothetical protein CVT25_000699 [Psilocybe cyanescens]